MARGCCLFECSGTPTAYYPQIRLQPCAFFFTTNRYLRAENKKNIFLHMTITEYNIPKEQKSFIDHIRQELKEYFVTKNKEVDGDICIIADYPLLFNSLGRINLLVLISIPNGKGNWFKVGDKFLNSLAFGIRFIKDDSIVKMDSCHYYDDEDGTYDYRNALVNEARHFNRKVKELGKYDGRLAVQFMDWVSSNNLPDIYDGVYAYGSNKNRPTIKKLIENICSRIKYKSIDSFDGRKTSALELTSILLNIAERQNKVGVILKGKINAITKKNTTQYYQKLKESVGNSLSIIKGPAGAGKTQLLTQLIYDYAKNGRHIRLLTYNKMLVKDIRLQLRSLLNTEVRSVSISTVDKFFYELCEDLTKKLSVSRSDDLIKLCKHRIELAEQILQKIEGIIGNNDDEIISYVKRYSEDLYIKDSDIEEIVGYIKSEHKSEYLAQRKKWIRESSSTNVYIKDKYYVLFLYYRDILKGDVGGNEFREFIESAEKKDSYYNYNPSDCTIGVSQMAKWSKIICIDEAQDVHILEKLILFNLRKSNEYNLVAALSGKDQIVRNIKETNWALMYGKPVNHTMIQLRKHSYRQKQNVISFINAFCAKVGLQNDLVSTIEGGRVILDLSNSGMYPKKLKELNDYGNGCGCSNYESLICLVPPSDDYIDYGETKDTTIINTNDTIHNQKRYANKCLKQSDEINSVFEYHYDGVASDKDSIITQQHNRIIHYESCRGLEAWTTACLDIDSYFDVKSNSHGAKEYALTAADIFSSSQSLQEQYAYQILALAFTRAIDTLYIKIKNPTHKLSKILINLSNEFDFVEMI